MTSSITRRQHLQKAKHNKNFFDNINESFTDWKITSLFYSAVHIIDAHAKSENEQFEEHRERFDFIRRRMRSIYSDFQLLYDYSLESRYTNWTNCITLKNSLDTQLIGSYENIKQRTGCNF